MQMSSTIATAAAVNEPVPTGGSGSVSQFQRVKNHRAKHKVGWGGRYARPSKVASNVVRLGPRPVYEPGISQDRRLDVDDQAMGHRIARRLKEKVSSYENYCAVADVIVKNNGDRMSDIDLQPLTAALHAIKSLPSVPKHALVHDVLRLSSAAVDALFTLMDMENNRLRSQLALLGGEEVVRNKETQNLRNEVLQMVANKVPGNGIPPYQGRRSDHGDAVTFFVDHYKRYTQDGQAVIFAPDLKAIDERLLIALRNQCGGALPLGDRSDRTDAIAAGKFVDAEDSKRQALVSVSHRSRRAKYQAAYS